MTYKALNTFIDDLFAFIIKMPTLYRLGKTSHFLMLHLVPTPVEVLTGSEQVPHVIALVELYIEQVHTRSFKQIGSRAQDEIEIHT